MVHVTAVVVALRTFHLVLHPPAKPQQIAVSEHCEELFSKKTHEGCPLFLFPTINLRRYSSAATMAAKTKLSKGILDMKFMKRTKDKVTKEQDDAEGRAMYASQITDKMLRHGECPYISEPSFVPVEGLLEGRFSFRGMNPEIERLLELEDLAKQETSGKDVKKDVADEEMADSYYGNVAQTMTRKYNRNGGGAHHQNGGGGHRRKMNLPEPANGKGNTHIRFDPQQQHQQRHSGPPKRPRYLKPDED